MTVGEIVYYILDRVKAISDDSITTESHALFLAKKYRSFLVKKEQEREKSSTDTASEFEYQEICLDLEKVPAIDGEPCLGGYYLRTTKKIPKILEGNVPRVYPVDFYQGTNVVYVPRDRMRYTGTNKYLRNIIYVSLGADLRLYLNSSNPQFLYLDKLRVAAVFEDFDEAAELLCDKEGNDASCDVLDMTFPIRDYLVPSLIELCVKEITGLSYAPKSNLNNAADELADIMSYVRRNMKSDAMKQMEQD